MHGFDVFRKQEEDDGEMSNFSIPIRTGICTTSFRKYCKYLPTRGHNSQTIMSRKDHDLAEHHRSNDSDSSSRLQAGLRKIYIYIAHKKEKIKMEKADHASPLGHTAQPKQTSTKCG